MELARRFKQLSGWFPPRWGMAAGQTIHGVQSGAIARTLLRLRSRTM